MAQYFIDYTDPAYGSLNNMPPNHSSRWLTTETVAELREGLTFGRGFLFGGTSLNYWRGLSIDSEENPSNVELFIESNYENFATASTFGQRIEVRASEISTNKKDYYVVNSDSGQSASLYRRVNDTAVLLIGTGNIYPNLLSSTTKIRQRFSAQGVVFRYKRWPAEGAEPSGWHIEYTDNSGSAFTDGGWFGFSTFVPHRCGFYLLGVGTNGDPAPTGPVIGGDAPTLIAPTLIAPANTATGVIRRPEFTWN